MEVVFRRAYAPAVFAIALAWFYGGLAPGLTFEDSGELATAAYLWGVPHPPGYAAWTILAAIWMRLFGAAEPVWATNLLSAVLSAAAAAVLALTAELWREGLAPRARPYLTGVLAALFFCASPHLYRQSIITEVYGLHVLVWALFFYQSTRYWLAESSAELSSSLRRAAFLVGFAQTVHNLGVLLIPLAAVTLALARFKGLNKREFGILILLGLGGALPFAYLWFAAIADRGFTWSDTNTLPALWTHLSRKQYSYAFFRDPAQLLEELRQQVIYIFEQYYFELIFVAICGLLFVFNRKKSWGWLWVASLLVSGPITAVVINFELDFQNQYKFQDATSLASVFYLQHYLYWATLIALAPAAILVTAPRFARPFSLLVLLVLSLFGGKILVATYQQESKNEHRLTGELLNNLEAMAAKGGRPSMILVNWDPFSFPLLYAQRVNGRFPETMIVDVEMIKAPWYQRYLERNYPKLRDSLGPIFKDYQERYRALGENVDGGMIKDLYTAFENYIGDIAEDQNVYIALWRDFQRLPIAFPRGHEIQSAGAAGMLLKKEAIAPALCASELRVSPGDPAKIKYDRLNQMIVAYYGDLLVDLYNENSKCPRAETYARLEELAPYSAKLAEKVRKLPRP